VKSEEGNGSRFIIRLPLKRASPIAAWPSGELEPRTALDAPSIAISSENTP
jgi:hypothetical protein